LQIKNKGEELKLLQRKIANLNKTIESLQLNHEKEMSERSILDKELSKTINQSKIWTSEKSVLERQVSHFYYQLIVYLVSNVINQILIFHFRFLNSKLNSIIVKQRLRHYKVL